MKTDDVGDLSELAILKRLVQLGYTVSVPYGKNQRYDVIVDTDGQLFKAQCKTGRLKNGVITFKVHSHSRTGTRHYKGEVDWFLVYCPETDLVYRVCEKDVGVNTISLRVQKPQINRSTIKWARDYIL